MMRTITVSEGQSLIDVAVQHCGDAVVAFDIAQLNILNLTDKLAPGQTLIVPDAESDKAHIVTLFKKTNHIPASVDAEEGDDNDGGIGFWEIGVSFTVS